MICRYSYNKFQIWQVKLCDNVVEFHLWNLIFHMIKTIFQLQKLKNGGLWNLSIMQRDPRVRSVDPKSAHNDSKIYGQMRKTRHLNAFHCPIFYPNGCSFIFVISN